MRRRIGSIVLVVIGIVILLLLIWKINIDFSIIYTVKKPIYILFAALLTLAAPLVTAFRMKYFLLTVGKNTPMKEIITVEYINKLLYYVAPFKLNVPAKGLLLNKMCGVRKDDSASIVTFEYSLDTSIMLAIGFVGAVLLLDNLSFPFKAEYLLLFFIACVIVFFCIPSTIFDELLRRAEQIRNKMVNRVSVFILGTAKAIRVTWINLAFNRKIPWIMFITAIMWALSILIMEVLFLSLTYYVPLMWILVVSCCGLFVGGITTIPGGLGVREATMVFLYSALGVPQEMSIIVVLLARLLTIVPIIVGYIASLRAGLKLL